MRIDVLQQYWSYPILKKEIVNFIYVCDPFDPQDRKAGKAC